MKGHEAMGKPSPYEFGVIVAVCGLCAYATMLSTVDLTGSFTHILAAAILQNSVLLILGVTMIAGCHATTRLLVNRFTAIQKPSVRIIVEALAGLGVAFAVSILCEGLADIRSYVPLYDLMMPNADLARSLGILLLQVAFIPVLVSLTLRMLRPRTSH